MNSKQFLVPYHNL